MRQSVSESRGLTEKIEPDSAGSESRAGNPDIHQLAVAEGAAPESPDDNSPTG